LGAILFARDGLHPLGETGMDRYLRLLGGAWDFAAAHPFVCAWLALTTVWALFTVANRHSA
jgi:hypothetical protein